MRHLYMHVYQSNREEQPQSIVVEPSSSCIYLRVLDNFMAIDSTVKNPFQVSLWTACMKSIDAQLYHLVTIDVCISYNTGKSALPDILICTMPEGTQRPRASAYISGKA